MEGTISADSDPPQEMGDASLVVTEEMEEKASSERSDGMMAAIDGVWGGGEGCGCEAGVVFLIVCR